MAPGDIIEDDKFYKVGGRGMGLLIHRNAVLEKFWLSY